MINPGIYNLNLDNETLSFLLEQSKKILEDDINFPIKNRNGNIFKKINSEIQSIVTNIISYLTNSNDLIWEFEIFLSRNPVTEHNDRNYNQRLNLQCQRGFIMPLEWQGKQPSTLMYNQWYDDKIVLGRGRKFFKLEERNLIEDNNIKFTIEDCKLIDNMIWQKNTCIIFDSRQIHSSNDFIQDKDSYKLSINGLGYSVVKM